jgi:hypothetical protein
VKITGLEPIAPALAVVPSDGKAMMFLGKGQSSPLPAADPAMKTATTFQVGHVARQDWEGPDGRRRGTDVEACLSPGG